VKYLLVLALTVFAGIASAQKEPTVYSDDGGNLKIEVADGKQLSADSAYGGKPSAVQILAKIKNLQERLDALKTKGTDQKAVEEALKVRTVTDAWEGSDGHYINLGLFTKSQSVNLDVSHQGCMIHSGFSYTVAAFQTKDLRLEVFSKGDNEYQSDKFSLVASEYTTGKQATWGWYWLWLKVDSTCADNANADGQAHKTTVKAQVGVQGVNGEGLIDAEAADVGAKQANTPPGRAVPVEVISLEKTFEGASDIRGTVIRFDAPFVATELPKYDIYGDEIGESQPGKKFEEKYVSLGLATANSILSVEIDVNGCGIHQALTFRVVGSVGNVDNAYDRKLTAYTFAVGGKPTPKWLNGGFINPADLVSLKFEPNPNNEKLEFYLWVKVDGILPGDSSVCDNKFVRVTAKVSSAAGSPMADFDVDRRAPRTLGDIPTISFEELADRANKLQPEPVVMKWTETKDVLSTPEPLYLGVFRLDASINLKVESTVNCGLTNGYHFHLSPGQQGTWDRTLKKSTNHIVAYEFGSAADKAWQQDRIAMFYKKVGGQAHIWLTTKPRTGACEKEQTNTLKVWASIDSNSEAARAQPPFQDEPPMMDDGGATYEREVCGSSTDVTYPLEEVEIVSLTDTLANLVSEDGLRDAAALAVGKQIFRVKWEGSFQSPLQEPEDKQMFTKYIGTFKADEVVHIDATDTGCGTNVGIYANVVSRNMYSEKQTPESFIMGTAVKDGTRDALQLYWRASPNPNVESGADKTWYDLYVGVVEQQCPIPKEFREDKTAATQWWKDSYFKGTQPQHLMELTVKRSGKAPALLIRVANTPVSCDIDEAYVQQKVGEKLTWVCSTPQELKLKEDGSVQSPGDFELMSRISAEDIALAALSEPQIFGHIVNWDAALKAPKFGATHSANTVLPYETTITEKVSAHGITRNFHYQYIELPDGISDPDGMMYAGGKCRNCDDRTGYMYLGKFNAEQIVHIDFADISPWAFGQSIICTGKPFYGKVTNAQQVSWKAPKCFTSGSGKIRQDLMTVVYAADLDDKFNRAVNYWLASAAKPSLRSTQVMRRDYKIQVKTMPTLKEFEKAASKSDNWRFGQYSKADQTATLGKLNAALDRSATLTNTGVLEFISMEDTAAYSAFPLPE